MYYCHTRFYLIGRRCKAFEIIKEMAPLEHFSHEFLEGDRAEDALLAQTDVIFIYLPDVDGEIVPRLLADKNVQTECILLAEEGQIAGMAPYLSQIKDIWTLPMSEEEIQFRFLRWQQTYKMSKDFWQTNQYLEATINNNPNLIWYKDKNGIHEKVNDSFCKTVNKTKQQVEGRGHAYIWDVEYDDPACIESERIVMSKKQTCVSEETVKTGDGIKLLTTYKSPLYNLDGSVMGTVGVAIDVTQERAYEREIINKNHTLETLFAASECGILCHTVDGSRIISVNQAALKILGYKSQEELMKTGFDMIASSVMEEDREQLRTAIRSLKKEGDSISVEYRVQHTDGEVFYILGNVKLLEQEGELVYQRFLLDCTTQKIQEKKEQLEKEERQTELVQALGIDYNLVCFFDLDTGMGGARRIEGCKSNVLVPIFNGEVSMTESLGKYIQACVYEEDRELLREAVSAEHLRRELAEKRLYHVNYRVFCDGEIKYFQMKAVRAGEWEESQGVVLGFRSVDEEIRSEMEKQSLLETALLQAKKANEAKSAFLSNMSHDIRTPMNAIVGFTTLAMAHLDSGEQVGEYLEKIQISGNHLLRLINNILDMSRIESGKIQLEEKPCNLWELIEGLQNIIQVDVYEKRLSLHVDTVNIRNENIYCDQLRLNQVLLNLLSNSVKYTEPGGSIRLIVTEKDGAPDGCADYEFCIEDTGIGMSDEFITRIFDPFERERNSTISGIQGTGLGMAITKNIVEMMDGVIEVESQQGAGTKICVSLTFRLCSGEKKPQPAEKNGSNRRISWNNTEKSGEGRILLVEDVELNQEIAVTIISEAGFEVEVAENGRVAVEKVKNSEPGYYQLILMDIQMPVMNGYEATKEIRKLENPELACVPIFAMSANAFEEDKQKALECGMDGHIAKPIDINILFDTLNKVLN